MEASQDLQIISANLRRSEKTKNGLDKAWEMLQEGLPDPDPLEPTLGWIKSGGPAEGGRKRSRHSYVYCRSHS